MPELLGAQVPLFRSLPVAYHAESAKRPKAFWIVRCSESQSCGPAAQFRRLLVQRPRTNDVIFREQPVGFRQNILSNGVVDLMGR